MQSISFNSLRELPQLGFKFIPKHPVITLLALSIIPLLGWALMRYFSRPPILSLNPEEIKGWCTGDLAQLAVKLTKAAGDRELNGRLLVTKGDLQDQKDRLGFVAKFIHKIGQDHETDGNLVERAGQLLKNFLNGEPTTTEKLFPLDVKRLEELARFSEPLETIFKETQELMQIRENCRLANEWVQRVKQECENDPNWQVEGDINIYILNNDGYLQSEPRSFIDRMTYIYRGGSQTHTALSYREGGKNKESHMWARTTEHSITDMGIGHYGNQRFRINWDQILPDSIKKQHGIDKIQSIYSRIVHQWHEDHRKDGVTLINGNKLINPLAKRLIIWTRWFSKWRIFPRDWRDQAPFQNDGTLYKRAHEVSCSEFTTRVTLLCLRRLELELNGRKETGWKRPEREYWKEEGFVPLNLNINPWIRIQRLSPIDIVQRGQKKNLGTEIKPPPIYQAVVKS